MDDEGAVVFREIRPSPRRGEGGDFREIRPSPRPSPREGRGRKSCGYNRFVICPRCSFENPRGAIDCLKCGVVFA